MVLLQDKSCKAVGILHGLAYGGQIVYCDLDYGLKKVGVGYAANFPFDRKIKYQLIRELPHYDPNGFRLSNNQKDCPVCQIRVRKSRKPGRR